MRKIKMFEEFNPMSDETPIYTWQDIRDYEKLGRVAVTLYPKQKGSRDSFTLCDRSDVAIIKDSLEREGIWNCKVVYGPEYFNGKRDPKCLTVIASKEDEKKVREIGSVGFSSSYAHPFS
jgi:hypothetical protein